MAPAVVKRRAARYAAEQERAAERSRALDPEATMEVVEQPDGRHALVHAVTLDGKPAASIDLGVIEPDTAAATTAQPLTVTFESSNVRGAAFDAPTGVLEVEFANGKRYWYGAFTDALLTEWRAAESPGKWFDLNVKKQPLRHPPIVK